MFRAACDNSVTTSPPASPPTANLTISKYPPASPICTKPDRANPSPLPHHRAPAAHRNPSRQPFRHPHAPTPAGPAVSFHSAHSRLSDLPPPTFSPASGMAPPARSRNIPMPADDGDQDRGVVGQEMKPDPVAGSGGAESARRDPGAATRHHRLAYMRQTVRTNNPVAPPRRHPGVLRSPRLQRPHRGHQRRPGSVAPQRPRIPKPHSLPRALTAAQRRTPHTRQCTLNYEEPVTLPSAATEGTV